MELWFWVVIEGVTTSHDMESQMKQKNVKLVLIFWGVSLLFGEKK